jgi:LysM repeat protein
MASRDEQIRVANRVLQTQGIGAWPVCGARAGSSKHHRHRSISHEASRSYKRRSYQSHSSRSRYSKRHRAESTKSWQHTSETRSLRSHHRKRAIAAAPKVTKPVAASGPVRAVSLTVPDFVALRTYSSMTPAVAPKPVPVTYLVRPGDSLISIATGHKVSWQALYARNRAAIGTNPNLIAPGTRLVVR